jgi:hypothetical protein
MASARRDNCLKQLLTPVLADDEPGRRTIDVLRELPPDQLAEFRAKAAVASEQNQLAIQNLREAERIELATKSLMGEMTSAFPAVSGEAVLMDVAPDTNGGANAYVRSAVDSVGSGEPQAVDLLESSRANGRNLQPFALDAGDEADA